MVVSPLLKHPEVFAAIAHRRPIVGRTCAFHFGLSIDIVAVDGIQLFIELYDLMPFFGKLLRSRFERVVEYVLYRG